MNTLLKAIGALAATTFIPGLELRASIPLGFFHSDVRAALGLPGVVLTCLIVNIFVGIIVFALILLLISWLNRRAGRKRRRRR